MIAKAAATVLSNEKLRKGVGWTLVAILSPVIVLIALLCSIGSGGADHNNQAVAAAFYGVSYSTEVPAEFRYHIEEMRTAFSLLDSAVASVNGQTESGNGLDPIRIKAVFYALCFGESAPSQHAADRFVDCFFITEQRTRIVVTELEDGSTVETEEVYTATVPLSLAAAYENLAAKLGRAVTDEDKENAAHIYTMIAGNANGSDGTGASGGAIQIDYGYGSGSTELDTSQFTNPAGKNADDLVTFPDVKPSHWASAYINMAARKGIISGFADGKFKPGQTVTAGQAVTILMRGLGYKDEDMGGVWPQSYMAEAQTNGLLKSTGITSAYAGLTRAQAARLFLNLFEAKHGKGDALFSYKVGEEVYLTAVDGGKGTMTAGGKSYTMAHPVASTSLIGSKGKAVLNSAGEILTFLPITGSNGVSNAAVIISANGSVAGLDSLAGSTSYNIYKNGSPATAADLKRYDVATYASATNSIIISDTRVSTYYEDCKPSPSNPATITVLGGKELNVLPTAADSLSKLKPGKQIVLLLTADGQVAGAEDANNTGARRNPIADVSEKRDVQ